MKAYISGMGICLPEKVVTNDDLAKFVDTDDEWIRSRTGIQSRRLVDFDDKTTTAWGMGAKAAREALKDAGVAPEEVTGIIFGGIFKEYTFPSAAALIQQELGCVNAWAFDISAACAFVPYAIRSAVPHIEAGNDKHILVIGSEIMSRILDWKDRGTCVLFGDAAAAMLLSGTEEPNRGIIQTVVAAQGSTMLTQAHYDKDYPWLKMDGPAVYKIAVTELGNITAEACKRAGCQVSDLDLFVPHQANIRIIESTAKRAGLPMEKVAVNLPKYGNTSAASVTLALYEARQDGRVKPGDLVALTAIGAGMAWGCTVLRW
jgi:3-oxoacyl-[acyl-carrier-protein] synthase-3